MSHEKELHKFGYPNTLIKEYDFWYWLLRPEQTTIGSSILITKDHYFNYSDLTNAHFSEFEIVVKELERTLKDIFNYDKINYLMLMMVDLTVHYHVIPRYSKTISFNDKNFFDFGYPGLPDFNSKNNTNNERLLKLIRSKV